jgi:hypothetical protein
MERETGKEQREFGRTAATAARGAAVLTLLGCSAVLALYRLFLRRGTPAGDLLAATGLPPEVILLVGVPPVLGLAWYGYVRSMRTAERYRITAEGLMVTGSLGRYTLAWEDIEHAEVSPSGALGIRIHDREALLATHEGTPKQREWLRTQEPFGDWDFLFHRADLGCNAQTVLDEIHLHLPPRDAPAKRRTSAEHPNT